MEDALHHDEEDDQDSDHCTYRRVPLVEVLRLLGNSNVCSGVHN